MRLFTWRRRVIVIGTTIGIIAIFSLIGYGIDLLLGTKPGGILVCFFLSFPVAQISMVRLLKRDIKNEERKP